MRLLAMGDVVGAAGCAALCSRLPRLRAEYSVDVCVVNGENAAEGNGILPANVQQLLASGVDVITTGNHGLRRREINAVLDEGGGLIRPANYHPSAHGVGWYVVDKLRYRVAVVNLQGVVYMENLENPFECMERLLPLLDADVIVVDFHAEATSEKLAMAYHLDGRVSALFGTHTHVQTADESVYPGGMAYITDIGMCGPEQSVLGVKPELALRRLRTGLPTRFENAEGPCRLSGVLVDIDEKTGKSYKIVRILLDGIMD